MASLLQRPVGMLFPFFTEHIGTAGIAHADNALARFGATVPDQNMGMRIADVLALVVNGRHPRRSPFGDVIGKAPDQVHPLLLVELLR